MFVITGVNCMLLVKKLSRNKQPNWYVEVFEHKVFACKYRFTYAILVFLSPFIVQTGGVSQAPLAWHNIEDVPFILKPVSHV